LTDLEHTVAELEQRLQASLAERDELLQQQAATNEVLQVINASSGDLAPVFDAILERAMRLCEAEFGLLSTYDGGQIRTVAARGVPPAYAAFRKNNPPDYGPGTGPARILAGERVVHIADVKSGDAYRAGDPNRRAVVDLGGARTVLLVPLLKNKSVLGYITIYRKEVRPYSDKQIVLFQNFADQAMIAIENARLFDEVQAKTRELAARNDAFSERIEHQSATIDVLEAMSASPGDAQPVFDLIVQQAQTVCGADAAALFEFDGALLHVRAIRGNDCDAVEAYRRSFPRAPSRETVVGRAMLQAKIVHVHGAVSDSDLGPEARKISGFATLAVPFFRGGVVIGAMGITTANPNGFSEGQVDLLKTFAEQAVIAISSAETFRSLQQRTGNCRSRSTICARPRTAWCRPRNSHRLASSPRASPTRSRIR